MQVGGAATSRAGPCCPAERTGISRPHLAPPLHATALDGIGQVLLGACPHLRETGVATQCCQAGLACHACALPRQLRLTCCAADAQYQQLSLQHSKLQLKLLTLTASQSTESSQFSQPASTLPPPACVRQGEEGRATASACIHYPCRQRNVANLAPACPCLYQPAQPRLQPPARGGGGRGSGRPAPCMPGWTGGRPHSA